MDNLEQALDSAGTKRAPQSIKGWLDVTFKVTARGSSLRTECLAALTTFATMAYVLAAHPAIISETGMDRAAVITVTALLAGMFSIVMGLMANLPIAQAPGMGANAFFTYTIVLGMGLPWEVALGLVFWSGVFFLVLTLTGIRRMLLEAFPDALKCALTAGIGLFLMLIGLKSAGIIVAAPEPTLVQIGSIAQAPVLLALAGIVLVMTLMARRIPGGIIITIAILTIAGMFIPGPDNSAMLTELPDGIIAAPAPIDSIFMALDIGYLWRNFGETFPVLLSLIFIDLFSSLASMNAMCRRAGLVDANNNMIKPTQALSADALATITASLMGTSTTNIFGESAAGIETGGRTGLVAIMVGILFLLAVFLNPILLIIPAQATAPALVFVGLLMFTETAKINFRDMVISGSATMTLIMMAITSLSDGMAIGLIIYASGMLLTGRGREVHPVAFVLAASFMFYYAMAV